MFSGKRVEKRIERPIRPIAEQSMRKLKDFRPPFTSTDAPNGIRRREPESDGTATRRPTSAGVRPMTSVRALAVGPKREIDIAPKKKPRVAARRARLGDPIS